MGALQLDHSARKLPIPLRVKGQTDRPLQAAVVVEEGSGVRAGGALEVYKKVTDCQEDSFTIITPG